MTELEAYTILKTRDREGIPTCTKEELSEALSIVLGSYQNFLIKEALQPKRNLIKFISDLSDFDKTEEACGTLVYHYTSMEDDSIKIIKDTYIDPTFVKNESLPFDVLAVKIHGKCPYCGTEHSRFIFDASKAYRGYYYYFVEKETGKFLKRTIYCHKCMKRISWESSFHIYKEISPYLEKQGVRYTMDQYEIDPSFLHII